MIRAEGLAGLLKRTRRDIDLIAFTERDAGEDHA